MTGERTPRIIVMDEELSVREAGMERLSAVRKDVREEDALEMLMGASEIDPESALVTDEINTIAVDLTDKEAADLAKKSGVASVEDDVWNHASGLDDDDLDDMTSDDPEASDEVDAAQFAMEGDDGISDEAMMAQAELASTLEFDGGPEIDFDEDGNAFALEAAADPLVTETAKAAGIDRDKLIKLLKCVVKCAMRELSDGRSSGVEDALVAKLLAEHGVVGESVSVQAIRDYITCGLRIIYARHAWRYSTGGGVRVAIVDTGIKRNHRDLRVYGGASFVPGVRSWADDQGHGTHVAGTVAALANNRGVVGVAPDARLYSVKVLNSRGSGRSSWIINGLIWCYRHRMHVANLSLGSRVRTHNPRVYSTAYERAGRLLRRRGILAVAAAGNSNEPVGNPARCPSFMAVSAVDCKRRRARFSCYGPQVEVAAPGVQTWSTDMNGHYSRKSGTSMASPHAAGVAALIKRRHPSWSGDRIRVHMWRTATDLGRSGRDVAFGYGLVNAYRAVR